jgi:hypothetical protein
MANRSKLVVNPALDVRLHVDIRERGGPRRRFVVDASRQPAYAAAFVKAAMLRDRGALPRELVSQLEFFKKTRVLLPAERAPTAVDPEVPLARSLLRWLPPASKVTTHATSRLLLNPDLLVQLDASRPGPGLPLEGDFPSEPPLLWVRDPGTRMSAAYRPGRRLLETVLRLREAEVSPSSLMSVDRELLAYARILVPRNYREQRREAWRRLVAAAGRSVRRNAYAVLPGFLQPLQIAQLRRHLAALEREGYLCADLQGNESRLNLNDDTVATFVHRQSAALIRSVTRELVVPSFNYAVCYRDGAELERHRDRTLCAWNLSCLVESGHGADVRRSWPLCLDVAGRVRDVRLDWGEALLYRGDQIPHWRPRARRGEEQSLLLFFYSDIGALGSSPT